MEIITKRELNQLKDAGIAVCALTKTERDVPTKGAVLAYELQSVRVSDVDLGYLGNAVYLHYIGIIDGRQVFHKDVKVANAVLDFVFFGGLRRRWALRQVMRALQD